MSRWLVGLIIVLVIVIFILPNPAGSGAAAGNIIDALILFFRAFFQAISRVAT